MKKIITLTALLSVFTLNSFAVDYLSAEEKAKHEERRAATRERLEAYRAKINEYAVSEEFKTKQAEKELIRESYATELSNSSEAIRAANKEKVDSNYASQKQNLTNNADYYNNKSQNLSDNADDLLLEQEINAMIEED